MSGPLLRDGWRQGNDGLWRNDRFGGSYKTENALRRLGSWDGEETRRVVWPWAEARARIFVPLCLLIIGFCFGYFAGQSSAAVFEVELNANRDGWARLHAEGLWVDRDPALGRYSVMSSRGKPTTRRVRVEKGSNTIRVRALRWEDMDIYAEMARWPFGDPARPVNPVVPAPVNAAFVWGRVAGRDFERTLQPTDSPAMVPLVPDEE